MMVRRGALRLRGLLALVLAAAALCWVAPCALAAAPAAGNSPVDQLDDSRRAPAPPASLAWLPADPDGADIVGILRGDAGERFSALSDGIVPSTSGPYWLRLRWREATPGVIDWVVHLDNWQLADLRLFRLSGRGDWEAVLSGLAVEERFRELPGRGYAFHLAAGLAMGRRGTAVQECYLRVDAPANRSAVVVRVGAAGDIGAWRAAAGAVDAVAAGAYAALALAFLAMFLGAVERVYALAALAALIAGAGHALASGLVAVVYSPAVAGSLLAHLPELAVLGQAVGILLMLGLLRYREFLPNDWFVARLCALLLAVGAVALVFVPRGQAIMLAEPIAGFLVAAGFLLRLVVALRAFGKGRKSALVYLLAWGAELAAVGLALAAGAGILSDFGGALLAAAGAGLLSLLVVNYAATLLVRRQRRQLAEGKARLQARIRELEAAAKPGTR